MNADLIQQQHLLARLNHLECRERTYRRIGMGLFAVAIIGLFGAAQFRREAEVVEADCFVLRDADGNPRAVLGLDAKEDACLRLLDKNGKTRLELKANEIGALLAIYDENTQPLVAVAGNDAQADVTRSSSVICFHEGGKDPAITFGQVANHTGVVVSEPGNVHRLCLGLAKQDGRSYFGCLDSAGRCRLAMGTDSQGPALRLLDEKGQFIFAKP